MRQQIIPNLKEITVCSIDTDIHRDNCNTETRGLGFAYVQKGNTERDTAYLSWLELTLGCGGIFRLSKGEAQTQVLENKLHLDGREGEGEENGISNNSCPYTKSWRQEAFDGHHNWFSMNGV